MDIVWQAEDGLREKKVESDLQDLLKTLVAFSNSVRPDDTAKIFIGERDDGTVQGVTNPDNIQKKVRNEADKIYPEIYYRTEVYERDGKQCVRVDIKSNGLAPHFGGAAWIRKGSESVRATEDLYEQMVALRQSKIRVLMQWMDKEVTVEGTRRMDKFDTRAFMTAEWSMGVHQATIVLVNSHWITFKVHLGTSDKPFYPERSEPLDKLWLSWDDEKKRLKVVIQNVS
jgi:Putative DNA-binding domain